MGNILTIIIDVFCVFVASGLCPLPPLPSPPPVRTIAPNALDDEPLAPTSSPAVGRRLLEYDIISSKDNEIRFIEVPSSEIKQLKNAAGQEFQFELIRPCRRDDRVLTSSANRRGGRLRHAECTFHKAVDAGTTIVINSDDTGDDDGDDNATVILSSSANLEHQEEAAGQRQQAPSGVICRVTCAPENPIIGFE